MNIIIPMAGMGTRMRPHTLTTPKPLLNIAGKPIVQRLVEEISTVFKTKINEIGFIIGDFGKEVENRLCEIAERVGAKPRIYYQDKPLGTAHAVLCAEPSLYGNVIVAFADTLFKADFDLDIEQDSIIWTKEVENPSQFGVVKLDENNFITDFVEKPKTYVSNQAIIGIYYFKSGENLKSELKYLIDNNINVKGEYQLTDALENLKNKGNKMKSQTVAKWLDCGNKNATVNTNKEILKYLDSDNSKVNKENSLIIEPSYIGKNVRIENSIIGPYVSLEDNCLVCNSVVSNSIIYSNAIIKNQVIENSMIGHFAKIESQPKDLSISDYSQIIN